MNDKARIRTGQSCATDPAIAVSEFFAAISQPDMALVVFFCSSEYDLAVVAAEMNRLFAGTVVIGCTSAGEIGPAGYRDHSLAGFSLPGGACAAVTGRVDKLQNFDSTVGQTLAHDLALQLDKHASDLDQRFGFLLIDGLSVREEPVAQAFQSGLGPISLFGGSAGDDLHFARTWIFHDGAFRNDAAILALVATRFPLKTFKTQHFVCDEERLVVTEADPATRTVKEINGLPAVEEYARLVGMKVENLTSAAFAATPVVVVIDGMDYVRAIQKANTDGSLTFFSAIEEGLVLRIAHGVGLVDNLEKAFIGLRAEIGSPQLVISCDCILRNLEATNNKQKSEVGDIFRANHAVGFSTYGEQYQGVHVNQTLTGVAIGGGEPNDA
ncbi:MAG: FIST C-terminal domain-containing protein [Betaproteobacteria bacterium]|nr:FIST C-terminal domain-containing protein [Betaproteobacteria bacterium]